MDLLIIAPSYDPHAAAVKWAAQALGTGCTLIDYGSTPHRSTMSYTTQGAFSMNSFGQEALETVDPSGVWVRRPLSAYLDEGVSPYDIDPSTRSWDVMHESFSLSLAENCDFIANDPAAIRRAVLKPFQLSCAKRAGLSTPDSLISNGEEEIRAFIDRGARLGRSTIVKPLTYMNWSIDDGDYISASTAVVTRDDLRRSDVRTCPMVYQTLVSKSFEVRVVVCGASCIAIKINKLEGQAGIDWRVERQTEKWGCEMIDIPNPLKRSIMVLLDSMGLCTASLDFIVDENSEWVFLESNQAGNFLWIESVNPDVPILDMYAKFLVSNDYEFSYDFKRSVSLRKFEEDVGETYRFQEIGSDPRSGTRAIAETSEATQGG